MNKLTIWSLRVFLFLLWLVFSALLGGFVLSIKESMGINIFTATGYHALTNCLIKESQKAAQENNIQIPALPAQKP